MLVIAERTRELTLKGTNHQLSALEEVETRPVYLGQAVIHQRCGVGGIGEGGRSPPRVVATASQGHRKVPAWRTTSATALVSQGPRILQDGPVFQPQYPNAVNRLPNDVYFA